MEKQKVIVYVDGFNFYYGLKNDPKWRRYYWLDIVGLFEKFMRPNHDVVHLNSIGFDLQIPAKWKTLQNVT